MVWAASDLASPKTARAPMGRRETNLTFPFGGRGTRISDVTARCGRSVRTTFEKYETIGSVLEQVPVFVQSGPATREYKSGKRKAG